MFRKYVFLLLMEVKHQQPFFEVISLKGGLLAYKNVSSSITAILNYQHTLKDCVQILRLITSELVSDFICSVDDKHF